LARDLETTSLKAHLKAAPPAAEQGEAQWPGEGSFGRRAEYLEYGIALPPPLAAELEALAREMSLMIALAACGRNEEMRQ
jgi:LDH2 family malate/lactate/ureidoglycolate dehydrogenase